MKPIVCIVSFMTTPKPLRLSVTLPNAQIPFPMVKKAKLVTEKEYPYKYISYELFGKPQEAFNFNETATALARLISPIREMTKVELEKFPALKGYFVADSLEESSVLDFINLYGQVGYSDILRREGIQIPFMVTGKSKLVGLSVEQFCALVGISSKPGVLKAKAYFKNNPEEFATKVWRLSWGNEVPYSWINEDLRSLYRCVRILEILKEKDSAEFNLSHSVELHRFIHASDRAPFIIPFGQTPAKYKFLDEKWLKPMSQKEKLVEEFALNVNRFLQPITLNPLQTEKQSEENSQSFGVESFLIYSILKTEAGFNERFCEKENCQRPFYAQRSSKLFCSDSCANAGRQKRYRQTKRVSVQKNRKKAVTKRKKGKNG